MNGASMIARIRVPDFEAWKPLFDQDVPQAREFATGWQLYRAVEDPNEVHIRVDFESAEDAVTARERLLASGVLDRFPDRTGPTITRPAETVAR